MSPLVLKMTTAASCIYPKKPYQILFNSIFSSTSTSTSTPSSFSPSPPPFGKNFIEALTHTRKYSGCRITPCAPLPPPILPLPLNLAPRFPKCFSASSSSRSRSNASGGSFEDRGESSGGSGSESGPGGVGGLMADMGSENHKGTDWYDSQLYPNQDELLSPLTHKQKQQQQQSESSSKFLTLPTILTLGRVAAVPVLISTFYIDSWWGTTATTSIFIAAAITDWLDGYIARKMKLGSAFGAFLDPVADKLMVAATLVLLCSRPLDVAMFGQVPWLFVVPSIAIIGREITMSAVREWAASQNTKLLEAVAVNNLGKWKTATQMIALTILLATRDNSLGRPDVIVASGVFLLYVSAGLAVWSLIMYMSKIWKVLLR